MKHVALQRKSDLLSLFTTPACPVYKVPNDDGEVQFIEAVPYAKMYRFRGKKLAGMSRMEYFCTVKLVKASSSMEED